MKIQRSPKARSFTLEQMQFVFHFYLLELENEESKTAKAFSTLISASMSNFTILLK